MASNLSLTRFPDVNSLKTAIAVSDSDAPYDPAVATECAWYLRQLDNRRALKIARSLLAPNQHDDLCAPMGSECRGYLMLVLAEASCLNGDLAQAGQHIASARECFARHPSSPGHSDADWTDANLASDLGDYNARRHWMRQSLTEAIRLADLERVVSCTLALACFDAFEDSENAWALQRERVLPHLESNVPALRVYANFFMFLVRSGQAKYLEALEHAATSQLSAEQCGQMRRAIIDGGNVANIFANLGDLDSSLSHLEEILVKTRACGWPHLMGYCQSRLAEVMLKLGHCESSNELAEEAISNLVTFPRHTHYLAAVLASADASFACGRFDRARERYTIVCSWDCPSGRDILPFGLLGLAKLALQSGAIPKAKKLCLDSLALPLGPFHHSYYGVRVDTLRLLSDILEQEWLSSSRTESHCGPDDSNSLTCRSSIVALEGADLLSDPIHVLEHAITLADKFLEGATKHLLLMDLSTCLEHRGLYEQSLSVLRAAMSSFAAEKVKSATRLSIAFEARFKTERAILRAEAYRGAAEAVATRAAELESLNQQLHASLESLQNAQALLVIRNEELDAAYARIIDLSLTDPLTGLRNRRFLSHVIHPAVSECLRSYESCDYHEADSIAVANRLDIIFFVLDLDHFKDVNDTYGHLAGDAVLVQFSDRLRAVTRAQDFLVRWGGEEFLVAVRGVNRKEGPMMAERLRMSACSNPFIIGDGTELSKTVSIGFASFPVDPEKPHAASWEQAVGLADARLFDAKRGGRNCWVGDAPVF